VLLPQRDHGTRGVRAVTNAPMATTLTRWRPEGGAPVDRYTVEGGGHTVPSRHQDAPLDLGGTLRDLDAGELVADFFELARPSS